MESGIPLILPAMVILGVFAAELRSTPAVAWSALLAGFVLMVLAFRWPGLGASAILREDHAVVAVALGVARLVGGGCFLFSVVRTIRTSEIPW